MKFDESQLAFIESDAYPHFCLANAGSGKTASLLGKARRLALDPNRNGKVLILCFNRSIQDEIQEKLREQGLAALGVEAKTLHALGRSFIEQAVNRSGAPLSCITPSRNGHLYFGFIRKEEKNKYGSYPGLLSKILTYVGANSVFKAMDADLNTEINMLGVKILTEECPAHTMFDFDPSKSKYFLPMVAVIAKVLQKVKKTDHDNARRYGAALADHLIRNIDRKRKPVDFWKFFNRHFYRSHFVDFVHNSVLELIFKKDLYGNFADDDLDFAPKPLPLFYSYCLELDELPDTYEDYSKTLDDSIGAICISDLLMQVNQWKELDFDSMLSLGAYAMLKLKHNYHAVLVDEAQDLSLLYWYLTYQAYPKYLISDKTQRLVFVGDAMQAINRWNYACPERFVALANKHSRGQLIYTYRCPESIVKKAQEIKDAAVGPRVDLPEDRFISAAPAENQPGEYSLVETIDASTIDEFLKERGYDYSDIVILGRTNHDLLPWQLWLLIEQVPCQELLVNKLELNTDKTKTLLSLVALAEGSNSQNEIVAEDFLKRTKGEEATHYFLSHIHTMEAEHQDELILRFFTSAHLRDEEELSDEEIKEIAMGKGAVTLLRAWYQKDEFKLRSNFATLMARSEFQINHKPKGVSLSTIHRFKGREKNVVLIQSNSWSNICNNSKTDQQHAEESCLAYVAISRAKKSTHVIRGNVHPIL